MSSGLQRLRVPFGFVCAAALLLLARPHRLSLAIGLPLALLGLALRACAAGHIRKNDVLATTGPYRFTRNPLYLGSAVLALGLVVAANQWMLALLAALMLVGVYLPVIRREEQYLATRFGSAFDAYAARVPRLLPRWPRRGMAERRLGAQGPPSRREHKRGARPEAGLGPAPVIAGGFSFALYWRHREYQAFLGFLAIALVLIAKGAWPGLTPRWMQW